MVLGSLTGSFFGGIQSGKFGRKRSLMFDCLIFVVGTLLVALAPNFPLILIGRFIHGHSSASAMVAVPIYTRSIWKSFLFKLSHSTEFLVLAFCVLLL